MKVRKMLFLAPLTMGMILGGSAQQSATSAPPKGHTSRKSGTTNHGSFPLMFEANQGQADSQVRYISRGSNYSVYLTARGMVLRLQTPAASSSEERTASALPDRSRQLISPIRQMEKEVRNRKTATLGIDLVGASRSPRIVGEDPLSTKVNYFIGSDPSKWRRNVPAYSRIRYENIYPGIDLVYYGNNHKVEYDFDLAPGADPGKIQFSVKGADNVAVDGEGNLILSKDGAKLQFQLPAIYQQNRGRQVRVSGKYALRGSNHVGFALGSYDRNKPLVIDPVLVYSSLLGGSADTFGMVVAVDSSNQALVSGITDSTDFPLADVGTRDSAQFRMFVAKFTADGTSLLFADYFGGTNGGDSPYAMALDSGDNIYIAGCTTSSDFPLLNEYQSAFSGSQDAFLVKFAADGSAIDYSTYLGGGTLNAIGGSVSQLATSVAVDPLGQAIVAGYTQATDFPTTDGAYQVAASPDHLSNWGQYGFVTKFASSGASLVYSTYLAGSDYTVDSCDGCFPTSLIMGVTTDGSGSAYLTGRTNTSDFPTTTGAYAEASPADRLSDIGFVSKLSDTGTLAYSTYLGGFESFLNAIAVDGSGSAYVTGFAAADEAFPIINPTICDPGASACNGTVVAKLNTDGSDLAYSTFLGTANNMTGQAIRVDGSGNAFVVGSDQQFDLSSPIEQYSGNGDVVVAEIAPDGNSVLMATFFGGQGLDTTADSLAMDSDGAVYVTGVTQSADFPVTPSAFRKVLSGTNEAFIAKIDPAGSGPSVSIVPGSLAFGSQDAGVASAPQTALLRNMSSGPLTIASRTISGDSADFAEMGNCGATVSSASQCTLSFTFTPAAAGDRSGTLTITDDAQGGSQSVALSGTGVAMATANPSSLTFDPTSVGASSTPQDVTLTNNSEITLAISSIQLTGDFTNAGTDCGVTLAAHTSCTVHVSFSPASAGPLTGTLTFTDSATNSPQTVLLDGTGTDFFAIAPGGSVTVTSGGTATFDLNVTPSGGAFSGTVQLSCTGAPRYSACQVSPDSIVPGSSSQTAVVTVTTSVSQTYAGFGGSRYPFAGLLGLIVSSGLLLSLRRRRKLQVCFASVALLLLVLAGCGGFSAKPPVNNTTPPGTYNLKVTAQSGNLQHVTTLTLVVN